jgi:ABC-type uncharacterized transport system permease subunit
MLMQADYELCFEQLWKGIVTMCLRMLGGMEGYQENLCVGVRFKLLTPYVYSSIGHYILILSNSAKSL